MSFINLNAMCTFIILTLTLSLGALQPSCAAEISNEQEAISSVQKGDKTDINLDLIIEKNVNRQLVENNLKVNQMVEISLLKDINELKSSYSLSDSAATPILIAVGGTGFFFYSGNSLLTSFALSAGYGTYRFLISQYHHYRILHSLNTALTSTREEKIQLELYLASMSEAK